MERQLSSKQSIVTLIGIFIFLCIGSVYLRLKLEILLLSMSFIVGGIDVCLGKKWHEIEENILKRITSVIPAIFIMLAIGSLVGSWIFSGTIPMMIFYGFKIINPNYIYVTAFIITGIMSIVTGTSFGSMSTVVVVLIGIANGMGLSLPITAGAIISGSFLGDKLSPMSDTTNTAALMAGSDLYSHIKHMLYTTIPAALIAMCIYFFIGLNNNTTLVETEKLITISNQLDNLYNWNPLLLFPLVTMVYGLYKKLPTSPLIFFTSFISVGIGCLIQGFKLKNGVFTLLNGFNISYIPKNTEISVELNKILNRGGMESMYSIVVLILFAMVFSGVISSIGLLDSVMKVLIKKIKTDKGLIFSTMFFSLFTLLMSGSITVSYFFTSDIFKGTYKSRQLDPKHLSRALEDTATMFYPLVPWSPAAPLVAAILGVATLDYLPWAIVNYLGVIIAIIIVTLGIGIRKEVPKLEIDRQ